MVFPYTAVFDKLNATLCSISMESTTTRRAQRKKQKYAEEVEIPPALN